jgi:hypothetical protein
MIAGAKWRHVNGDELGQEKSAHSTGLCGGAYTYWKVFQSC